MKIVVLGLRGFPNIQGGVEKHCQELYPRMAVLGCDVTVISRADYTGENSYTYKGVKIIPLWNLRNKYLESFIHTFIGLFKAVWLKPDIVHIHAIGPGLFVPLAGMLRLKVVFTHHGQDYLRGKWNYFAKLILKLGESLALGSADQVIAVSGYITADLKKRFKRRINHISNGVEINQNLKPGQILEKYQLKPDKYILAVGRFVPEKGFKQLLLGFKKFSANKMNKKNLKLVLVGDADHADAYSRELKLLAKTIPDVVLTGLQIGKPLQELYSNAGIFVLPSFHEGLPIVLLEALSYGLSCIVSDIPANQEVGLSKKRYFKAGDINMLTGKLDEFINKEKNNQQSKFKRIKQVENKYNWDDIAEQTLGVYQMAAVKINHGEISKTDLLVSKN